MRHELTARQQEQLAAMQRRLEAVQHEMTVYVQGIIDGIPDSAPLRWSVQGTTLIGTLPE